MVLLCVVVCVGEEKEMAEGDGVYVQNTLPCVHSKRLHVYRHDAHIFHTCGRGTSTHEDDVNVHTGVVLNVHTKRQCSSAGCSITFAQEICEKLIRDGLVSVVVFFWAFLAVEIQSGFVLDNAVVVSAKFESFWFELEAA